MIITRWIGCTDVSAVKGVRQLNDVTRAGYEVRVLLLGKLQRAVEILLNGNDGQGLELGGGVGDAIADGGEKTSQRGDKVCMAYRMVKFWIVVVWQFQTMLLTELATRHHGQLHEQAALDDSSPRSTYPTTVRLLQGRGRGDLFVLPRWKRGQRALQKRPSVKRSSRQNGRKERRETRRGRRRGKRKRSGRDRWGEASCPP